MHATRSLLLSSSSSATKGGSFLSGNSSMGNKLLLPTATIWENMWSALQGVWQVASNPVQRQEFEQAIASQVIKDTVLQNAYNGSTMTFCLFHNLQNPLWKRGNGSAFDAHEFATAVGPALTNLHDFLHSFQNQIRQEYLEFRQQHQSDETAATEKQDDNAAANTSQAAAAAAAADQKQQQGGNVNNDDDHAPIAGLPPAVDLVLLEQLLPADSRQSLIQFLKQPHPWRQQAAENADSLAGRLSRMTTPQYLEGFCVSSKLGLAVTDHAVYQEGSAQVGQVAILSARAMEIPLPGQISPDDENDHRYEEFKASEQADLKMGVAAQIDVLYEVTNRFLETVPDESSSTTVNTNGEEVTHTTMKTEHVEYTSLGVAVFEGWLDKGGSSSDDGDEGLRWRVPLMREPFEFPMSVSAIRTVLDEPAASDAAAAASVDEKATTTSDSSESSRAEGTAEPENKPDESQKEAESKSNAKESSSSSS